MMIIMVMIILMILLMVILVIMMMMMVVMVMMMRMMMMMMIAVEGFASVENFDARPRKRLLFQRGPVEPWWKAVPLCTITRQAL